VEAVEALARRSLLAPRRGGAFSLQAVVLEYAAACWVEQAGAVGPIGAAAHGHRG
jgi:hypothetical protein